MTPYAGAARSGAAVLAVAALLWGCRQPPSPMFGFSAAGAARQADVERRFLGMIRPEAIRAEHHVFAAEPHPAGSARSRALMEHTREAFAAAGLEEITVTTHEVLVSSPGTVEVEMLLPAYRRAASREEPIAADPDTAIDPAAVGVPYHAYSGSGDVTAPVVYAGPGEPGDYESLARRGRGVAGRIALVRSAGPYSYRGAKVLTAERYGARAVLMFSDPDEERPASGRPYPDGPWGPRSRIQRGSVAYDFVAPGDPLTPGWASVAGAARLPVGRAALPRIPSAPIAYADARAFLDAERPVGRVAVRLDRRLAPVWTVTGLIRGDRYPEELVIAGSHRDSWIFGGIDSSGGSAALVELARSLGSLARAGWRPRRSILLASWDAEELALISSTEWGEQHAARLARDAVAYINVDSGASGSRLGVTAVPALNRVLAECARAVKDPDTGAPLAAAARERREAERGARTPDDEAAFVDNRPGGGLDFAVFLNHLGIPAADIRLSGPYGVYHSLYDTRRWVERFGDPGFRRHAALVQMWGLVLLRLAGAEAVPLDYRAYAVRLAEFEAELRRKPGYPEAEAEALRAAIARFARGAAAFERARGAALGRAGAAIDHGGVAPALPGRPEAAGGGPLAALNRRLMAVERALADPAGLGGRPWFRHLVYAPAPSYAPEVLPGVAAGIETGQPGAAAREARRLAAAIDRAARLLEGAPR